MRTLRVVATGMAAHVPRRLSFGARIRRDREWTPVHANVKYQGRSEPGGHITLSASHDGKVILRVKDTGVGISSELLPHIFDLFIQPDRSIDRAQGGLKTGRQRHFGPRHGNHRHLFALGHHRRHAGHRHRLSVTGTLAALTR